MNEFNLHDAHETAPRSTCNLLVPLPCTLHIRSRDRHNIPPIPCKKNLILNWILTINATATMSRIFSFTQLMSLSSLFLSFFFQKQTNKDVQCLERLIQCQFSFWVIPIYHSDLGDACPVAASALVHCLPVSRVDDHC